MVPCVSNNSWEAVIYWDWNWARAVFLNRLDNLPCSKKISFLQRFNVLMYFQNTWDINEILILKIILLKISKLWKKIWKNYATHIETSNLICYIGLAETWIRNRSRALEFFAKNSPFPTFVCPVENESMVETWLQRVPPSTVARVVNSGTILIEKSRDQWTPRFQSLRSSSTFGSTNLSAFHPRKCYIV